MNRAGKDKSVEALDKKKCYSCRSCFQTCTQGAIEMKENKEGFFYPEVNERCANCGLCAKHCPALNPLKIELPNQESVILCLKDEGKLHQSASGGLFAGIADEVIAEGGIVYGAAYDEDFIVSQTAALNEEELTGLKDSKYVESRTGNTYSEVKKYLSQGRKVFYSGTPCQIAGLKSFLGREYDDLLTADLICHGVPSQKLFTKYLEWLGKKHGGKVTYYSFRDKYINRTNFLTTAKIEKTGGKIVRKIIKPELDPYYSTFLRCETYRESCYACPYSSLKRPADISMGDFYEINLFYKADMTKGISLGLINTERGHTVFDRIKEKFFIYPYVDPSDYVPVKCNLSVPSKRMPFRDSVYEGIDEESAMDYFNKFRETKPFYKARYYVRRAISLALPKPVKKAIKKMLKME